MKFKKDSQKTNEQLAIYAFNLRPLIKAVVNRLGFDLLPISFICENQTNYLRITILHQDYLITLNDCEVVSRELEKELDNKNLIPCSYILEVQSKGIDSNSKNKPNHEFVLDKLGLVIKS